MRVLLITIIDLITICSIELKLETITFYKIKKLCNFASFSNLMKHLPFQVIVILKIWNNLSMKKVGNIYCDMNFLLKYLLIFSLRNNFYDCNRDLHSTAVHVIHRKILIDYWINIHFFAFFACISNDRNALKSFQKIIIFCNLSCHFSLFLWKPPKKNARNRT